MRVPQLTMFIGLIACQSTIAETPPEGFELSPFVVDASVMEGELERLEAEHSSKSKEHWAEKIEKIKVGMTRKEVLEILESYAFPSPTVLTGGGNCRSYHLDKDWSWSTCYDNSGRSQKNDLMYDRVISIGEIVEMGWKAAVKNGWRGKKY